MRNRPLRYLFLVALARKERIHPLYAFLYFFDKFMHLDNIRRYSESEIVTRPVVKKETIVRKPFHLGVGRFRTHRSDRRFQPVHRVRQDPLILSSLKK